MKLKSMVILGCVCALSLLVFGVAATYAPVPQVNLKQTMKTPLTAEQTKNLAAARQIAITKIPMSPVILNLTMTAIADGGSGVSVSMQKMIVAAELISQPINAILYQNGSVSGDLLNILPSNYKNTNEFFFVSDWDIANQADIRSNPSLKDVSFGGNKCVDFKIRKGSVPNLVIVLKAGSKPSQTDAVYRITSVAEAICAYPAFNSSYNPSIFPFVVPVHGYINNYN